MYLFAYSLSIWGGLYLREEFLGHSYIFYIYIYMPLLIKNLPANGGDAGDASLIPQSGISPGVGNGNMLQYSCLENSRDRLSSWAIVHGVTKNQT